MGPDRKPTVHWCPLRWTCLRHKKEARRLPNRCTPFEWDRHVGTASRGGVSTCRVQYQLTFFLMVWTAMKHPCVVNRAKNRPLTSHHVCKRWELLDLPTASCGSVGWGLVRGARLLSARPRGSTFWFCKHNTSNDPFSRVQKCAVNGYRNILTITAYSLTTSAQLD